MQAGTLLLVERKVSHAQELDLQEASKHASSLYLPCKECESLTSQDFPRAGPGWSPPSQLLAPTWVVSCFLLICIGFLGGAGISTWGPYKRQADCVFPSFQLLHLDESWIKRTQEVTKSQEKPGKSRGRGTGSEGRGQKRGGERGQECSHPWPLARLLFCRG